MRKILYKISFLALAFSVSSCVAEYDLLEEINSTNSDVVDTPVNCEPRANTVFHNGDRIVYDDIFYLNIWPSSLNYLDVGKSLKGQDNQIGSQLEMEFNGPLIEKEYTVADHTITGTIQNNELVMYGSYPISGTKYVFFAEPGSIVKVELTGSGKWSASFCDVKFTVNYSGWTDNFTTDGNLTQSN